MRKLAMGLLGILLCVNGYSQEKAIEKQKVFKGLDRVEVNADFCSLVLRGHSSEEVIFQGVIESQENLNAYGFEINEQDGILRVVVMKPDEWKSHWGEVILTLPAGVAVEAETQSGKVEVTALKDCDLKVVSKSGHVSLNACEGNISVVSPAGDFKVAQFIGDLQAKTKTGSVDVKGVNGKCDIACAKGSIRVKDVQGKLSVEGGTGSLEVENVEGDVALKSTSGDTSLSVAKGNMVLKSFDGDVKLFNINGVFEVQSSTGNITGTRVVFTASSSFSSTEGNIKVQMNEKEDLAFLLKSSNSYLRAMGKSKKKSLKVGKGSIVITGNSTTGSQSYY
ncbi:DUF4097 family beta strand repeat-containing protein [Saccharicrinis fermentans]|nr:DUF4097 family beta strand repeat-containing protein [Saccharicrinis fermentans]